MKDTIGIENSLWLLFILLDEAAQLFCGDIRPLVFVFDGGDRDGGFGFRWHGYVSTGG